MRQVIWLESEKNCGWQAKWIEKTPMDSDGAVWCGWQPRTCTADEQQSWKGFWRDGAVPFLGRHLIPVQYPAEQPHLGRHTSGNASHGWISPHTLTYTLKMEIVGDITFISLANEIEYLYIRQYSGVTGQIRCEMKRCGTKTSSLHKTKFYLHVSDISTSLKTGNTYKY